MRAAAARRARTSAWPVGSCSATLALPALASSFSSHTTSAPIGTSPRAPAACASSSAARIQRRSTADSGVVASIPRREERGGRREAARPHARLLRALLAALLPATLRVIGLRRGRRLVLALLHVLLVDHHGLGDVLHRTAGREVLVHLLAVDGRTTRACDPEEQACSDHHDTELHARSSLRRCAVAIMGRPGRSIATHAPLGKLRRGATRERRARG